MKKTALLGILAALVIVAGPLSAFAQLRHQVTVINFETQNPLPGVWVMIGVKTAPGQWTYSDWLESDEEGIVHFDMDPVEGVFWKAILDPTEDPVWPNTYYWQISYPTTEVEWEVNP